MAMRFAVVFLAAMVSTLAPSMAHGLGPDRSPQAVEGWYKKLPLAREKFTKLHFYFYDIVTGEKPTAVEIARANVTSKSPTFFGLERVFDIPLTVEPETDSKRIGYGQGTYTLASQEDFNLLFTFCFLFTQGEYKGSTITVQGLNPLNWKYREMPIVGGSGVFRLARGTAVLSTYWRDIPKQNGIVEFTLLVLHY